MRKHTPGPWVVAQRQLLANRKPDDCVELLHMDGYAIHVTRDTLSGYADADIALIAAAPEMYEALKRCALYGDLLPELKTEVDAALAKAEGQS